MDRGLKSNMEPDEITIVVHGARGLQGKKPGRHKYSVIFGVGGKKYRTSVVKDSSAAPDWNEESTVKVGHATDQVFFTVMEKDDVLGQVVIPALSLQTVKGQVKKVALKPHKKCMNPRGELIYQCYISKQRQASMAPIIKGSTLSTPRSVNSGPQLTGFARLKSTLTPSPNSNSNKRENRSSLANFNKKLSRSIHNIFSFAKTDENEDEDKPSPNSFSKFTSKFRSTNNLDEFHQAQAPVITNVIPNIGTIKGGTRIIIEGRNLGLGKSDIVELLVCGSDLLDSVEYESANSIVCTTKECEAGKGDIWYETVSGGQTVVKNFFTFVNTSALKSTVPVPVTLKISDSSSEIGADDVDGPHNTSYTTDSDLSLSVPPTPPPESKESAPKASPRTPKAQKKLDLPSDQKSKTLGRISSNDNIEGRYKKNFMKHVRRASESIVAEQEGLKREDVDRHSITKKELQAEVIRLYNENQSLKNDNADMKGYIDRLIAKVIQHCPDALETV
ncbi:hypothetical protein LOTGIDRAFT_234610 [Lottia gigantea]|uniref:Uncharacterized protein n=1 Tax=Lottia gigantea TaxID=225164 RepID=V3ZV76_LOTGI|nr:hypothetical protein LOTGIDRAFT_234610 [Lottia gigantea]ESO88282.1 hypothetical protein LOTGIDRAFT_234610 [Lottia gigantea]